MDGKVVGAGTPPPGRAAQPGRYIRALADGKPDGFVVSVVARGGPAPNAEWRREGYPALHVHVSTILPSPRTARGMGDPFGTGCDCASVDPGGHSIAVVASPWASQV